MFDIGPPEFFVLAIAALLIFGPEKLPTMAKQAGKWVRDMKGMATNVRKEFSEQTGISEDQLDPRNLDPKRFLREQVLGGTDLSEDDFRDADPRDAFKESPRERPKPTSPDPAKPALNGKSAGDSSGASAPAYDSDAT